ncbi:MAG: hypothetical protein C5B47_03960 [Verrucomicrobia bacterium]|nr:MAG: hypothetical protein C5B47_03960 [Verrucomicrobiota bacterium]
MASTSEDLKIFFKRSRTGTVESDRCTIYPSQIHFDFLFLLKLMRKTLETPLSQLLGLRRI